LSYDTVQAKMGSPPSASVKDDNWGAMSGVGSPLFKHSGKCQSPFRFLKFTGQSNLWFKLYFM